MDKNEYINRVLAHIGKPFAAEIKAELENHIADREQYYAEIGYDVDAAAQKAVEHMGSADTVGKEMNMLYHFKKHKKICITFFILFTLLFLFYRYVLGSGYFIWIYETIQPPILCMFMIFTYIIYKYAFLSRNRVILFLLGVMNFVLILKSTDFIIDLLMFENNFQWIYSVFTGAVFVINSIVFVTCSGEITAAVKGKPNYVILNRYEKYGRFLLIAAAISIVMAVFAAAGVQI